MSMVSPYFRRGPHFETMAGGRGGPPLRRARRVGISMGGACASRSSAVSGVQHDNRVQSVHVVHRTWAARLYDGGPVWEPAPTEQGRNP